MPPEHDDLEPLAELEAGVIDDARARQSRERWIGAIVAVAAVVAGLIFGLSGGGGGATGGRHAGGGGTPSGAGHQPAVAVLTRTPAVTQFGLASLGVGWVANGTAFYVTRNGGRAWIELSRSTSASGRHRQSSVRAFDPIDAISSNITAASSPSARVIALGFVSRMVPLSSRCQSGQRPSSLGAVTVSADAGRTWATHLLPGCNDATSLSFVDARTGYAVLTGSTHSSSLYRTGDGGRRWRLVSRFPAPMTVSFGNSRDGLALVTANTSTAAGVLYATTDGGRNWRRSKLCGPTADPRRTVYCGAPSSFGRSGVVPAVVVDGGKSQVGRAVIYATADAGRRWAARRVPPLGSSQFPSFSAPSADDLFLYSLNGVLHTSTDGGRSWSSISEPGFKDLDQMQFVSADYGWVTAGGRLEYTVDGGRRWRPVGTR